MGQVGARHKDLRVIRVDRAFTLCECPQKAGVETEEYRTKDCTLGNTTGKRMEDKRNHGRRGWRVWESI